MKDTDFVNNANYMKRDGGKREMIIKKEAQNKNGPTIARLELG